MSITSIAKQIPGIRSLARLARRALQGPFVYAETFSIDGTRIPFFEHPHNVGVLTERMTERAIELALADRWLKNKTALREIGAVTPYYWPGRISVVIDPCDTHALVTSRTSLFDHDFTGCNVLSISTVEHVGSGDYGLSSSEKAADALDRILSQSASFFITFPLGYNAVLDQHLRTHFYRYQHAIRIFTRNKTDNLWKQESPMRRSYTYGPRWANALAVFMDQRSSSDILLG